LTPSPVKHSCQEDGCKAETPYRVTCEGTTAVMTDTLGAVVRRDCARSFTECDPTSETGCTDRHFTQCDPSVGKGDRCDGNVRLGCDGAGQVSYHDCSILGGTCGTLPNGAQGCIYPHDATCTDGETSLSCDSGGVTSCVAGRSAKLA